LFTAAKRGAMAVTDSGWPDELSPWRIGDELGRGGMGVVYSAADRDSGEDRAIKVISSVAPDDARDALFRRELKICESLAHRNIVRSYASGQADKFYFLVTELCAGGSVARAVKSHGVFTVDQAMKMIFDVLAGLEYVHSVPVTSTIASGESAQVVGLVHRDVKPANILIRTGAGDRVYVVADFGLAKAFRLAGMSGVTTKAGTQAGTPDFMCRQQVGNYKYSKPEVDVWAAAATLYYALTGCLPRDFPPGQNPWSVVTGTQPVSIAKRGRTVPERLARVIDEALVDRPGIRYQTAAEFRAALEAV
jgi:serine/threonine protein kinase